MNEDQELITEFLIESTENLARLDQEMVELEKRPDDAPLLASVFRTIHTIKGTCGFLGFGILEAVTHIAESILSQIRNGDRPLTPELVSLVLESVDATKQVLTVIEATGKEGGETYEDLRRRLQAACDQKGATPAPALPAAAAEPEPEVQAAASAPREEADKPKADRKDGAAADSTIRVDVGLLDKLMNLVGELVLARNQILQFNTRLEDATFNATSQRLNLITSELQEGVMKTRMQPIGMVWNKLPRVVRDLSSSCGKQISLEMDGAETELDKTIIEAIKDPLTHIVRNCCDHGIEHPSARVAAGKPGQGKLLLRAFHEGGHVNIEIIDDGAGIDPDKIKSKAVQKGLLRPEQAERMGEREAVNLVFLPGFSTAEKVTNISGRGVGMDVVKTNIEKIGGVVDLVSQTGHGTTVKIKIPLTLAIIPGLVVTCGAQRFVIPQVSLLELVRLEGEEGLKHIERIHGTPVYRRRGSLLPIAYLREILAVGGNGAASDILNIVVLQAEDRQFGLVVDGINDTQEIVVKPLGKQLKGLSCYSGATIMGDGKVALILDVMGVARLSGVMPESRESGRGDEHKSDAASARSDRETVLLFKAGSFERLAVPLALVARLEEFPVSKIERAAGRSVVQYRGQILPLLSLARFLDPESGEPVSTAEGADEPTQVIVFSDGGGAGQAERRVGIVVDRILDIVEEEIAAKRPTKRRGLLGSAVVGKHLTDFVDLHTVIGDADESWFAGGGGGTPGTVLITEPSRFNRGLLANYLVMAGYRVIAAWGADEALEKMGKDKVNVVLTALDLPEGGAAGLVNKMRQQPGLSKIPVLALTTGQSKEPAAGPFAETLDKFDREAMLRSVERLMAAVAEEPVPVGGKR